MSLPHAHAFAVGRLQRVATVALSRRARRAHAGASVCREQREWSAFYRKGQLSDLGRKTVEPMVLALRGDDRAAVRAVQQLLGEGA